MRQNCSSAPQQQPGNTQPAAALQRTPRGSPHVSWGSRKARSEGAKATPRALSTLTPLCWLSRWRTWGQGRGGEGWGGRE